MRADVGLAADYCGAPCADVPIGNASFPYGVGSGDIVVTYRVTNTSTEELVGIEIIDDRFRLMYNGGITLGPGKVQLPLLPEHNSAFQRVGLGPRAQIGPIAALREWL